ncbi:MAG: DUF721 domain-containing protein [Solirubrobacterales bacterium]
MVHRRDPFPLADALGEFTRDAQPASVLAQVQSVWAGALGETLARWATPVGERGGVVVVECSDSMVANELNMMKETVLAQLAEALPDRAPTDLKFRVK